MVITKKQLIIVLTLLITDIKDEAQHKRVQKKLFENGCEWDNYLGGKILRDLSGDNGFGIDHIKIDEEGILDRSDTTKRMINDFPSYTRIPASEFLGEVSDDMREKLSRELLSELSSDLKGPSPKKTFMEVVIEEQNRLATQARIEQYKRDGLITPNPYKYSWGKVMPDNKVHWGKDVQSIINQYKQYQYPSAVRKTPVAKGLNKTMSNIVNFFNDLTVSSEDKELRKAGLKDGELNWTYEAREIVLNLEAKERGYKDFRGLAIKSNYDEGSINGLSMLELDSLFTKFYDKLLDTAKKFNKKNDKK